MYPSVWTPHMTVAAVTERDGTFLLVEEVADGARVFNQPAGHLEPGESLQQAVVREVLEETGSHFTPHGIVGVYRWVNPDNHETHVRVTFHGSIDGWDHAATLDDPIIAPHWLAYDAIQGLGTALRSPLVLRCIDDFRNGSHYPLDVLRDLA